MSKRPLRPTTASDAELTEAGPDADTEVGKANKLAEKYKKPDQAPDKSEEKSSP